MAGLTPDEKRGIVKVLRTNYSVRQICNTLGFNRSNLYYQPTIFQHSPAMELRFRWHTEGVPWENGYAERLIRTLSE